MDFLLFMGQLYLEIAFCLFIFFYGVMYAAGRVEAEGVAGVALGSAYLAAIWPKTVVSIYQKLRSMV